MLVKFNSIANTFGKVDAKIEQGVPTDYLLSAWRYSYPKLYYKKMSSQEPTTGKYSSLHKNSALC